MKRLLFLLMTLTTLAGYAQYPISSINISMPSSPAANTADWATAMPPVMITAQAQMRNGQVPGDVQECRILVTVKQGGSKKYGAFTQDNAPSAGFTTAVKTWSGGGVTTLLGNGTTLPAGTYELCVQFFSYNTPAKPMSNEVCKNFTIADTKPGSYTPPVNISPVDKKEFSEKESKEPLTFRWTPLVPRPRDPVVYKLRVWQLMQGQNPSQAMQTTQPIIEKEIKDQTQFLYRKGWDGWPKNGSAVWRVEATDGQGKVLGVSEATAFTVKKGWNGVTQDNSANKTSGTCNCVAPTPFYGKEYPSSALTLSTTNPWPAYIPPSELSSGNKIHFSFTSGPCLNTISDPCNGFYKATVNGIYSFNSTTVGYGSQTHIEIPISYLHTGPNNITVQGICGSTTCDLAPSTVIVSNPPTSSGTITLVKECCTVSDRILPYATYFTGKVSFKMAGSVSSAVLEINSASGLSYEPFVSGGSTACYSKPITIKLVNNLTHVAIGSSTINGAPFLTYNLRFDFSCMKWIKIDISRAFYAALLPHGPRWIDSNLADVANTFDPSLIDGHRLISTLTNTKTKEVVTIKSIVDISENGDMNLIRIEEASSKLNQNNTPIQVLPQKKHSYIGHVTLLK